jgi:FKBP-type peptidyl-prolyl cis-trans isomerase (trigger factor)
MDIKKQKRPNAEVSLVGTLLATDIEKSWDKALAAVTKEISLPGFRKGHVPKDRIIAEVGEHFVWREAAEVHLKAELEALLKEQEIAPIAPLSLTMKPSEKGKDVEFEVTAIIAPTVEVGDYKAIAERALKTLPIEDRAREIEEAKQAFHEQLRALAKLPEGDAFGEEDAKKIGFENHAALDLFIGEEAKKGVENRMMQKRRSAVAEALIAKFPADIPTILTRQEADALMGSMKKDIAAQGLSWNDYLKKVKKTEEAVMVDMLPAANKRIALDLIFGAIAKKEDIKLEGDADKKAEDDLAHAVAKQGVPHDRAHLFARESLLREKVWTALGVKTDITVS